MSHSCPHAALFENRYDSPHQFGPSIQDSRISAFRSQFFHTVEFWIGIHGSVEFRALNDDTTGSGGERFRGEGRLHGGKEGGYQNRSEE